MGPLTVSGSKSHIGIPQHSFVYVLPTAAFILTQQRPGVMTEIIWLQSRKYSLPFFFFFFTGEVCQPLLYTLSFLSMLYQEYSFMIILSYLPHSFEKIHITELYRIFINEQIPY